MKTKKLYRKLETSGTQRRKKQVWLLSFVLLFILFSPKNFPRAEEFGLSETKLTLYQGNTHKLECFGVDNMDGGEAEESDGDLWWGIFNVPSFSSSDNSVAVVDDNGLVRAVGAGTAEITARYNGKEAVCVVKVRRNSCELDYPELVLYQGQDAIVNLTYKKRAKGYTYYLSGADSETLAGEEELFLEVLGEGRFYVLANQVGKYYVDFVIQARDGKDYSARCTVMVLPCGLTSQYLTVADGEKVQIGLENGKFLSYKIISDDEEEDKEAGEGVDEFGEDWDIYSAKAEISVSKKGIITAKEPGSIKLEIEFETAYHELRTETLHVHVTKPNYLPFDTYLWAGESYLPQFTGISPHSVITVVSEDEKVVCAKRDDWSGSDYLIPGEAGKTTIVVMVDGISFTQEVTVVNPLLSAYNMLLQKGKAKRILVTGIQKDNKITFRSSDRSVASVTKNGRITAKAEGAARITVKVDGREYYCTVTVGEGKAFAAVKKAEAVLGAPYSQPKRMQKGYYDCSSLVWRSYNEAGIKLVGASSAPTAAEEARKLEAEGKVIAYAYVPPEELKPGDLIFYQGSGNKRYKDIDHVAIYYGANYETGWWNDEEMHNSGMLIHAAGSVHLRPYEYYRAEDIVIIARPVE